MSPSAVRSGFILGLEINGSVPFGRKIYLAEAMPEATPSSRHLAKR
jgi:hypothetical protein